MTRTLSVDIRKEFSPNGPVVVGKLTQPTDQFSVTVLFGPSGCGKTTILRCLAGLVRPEQGRIEFDDEVWFDGAKNVYRSPQQRDIGFLFQDYSLFPHLTVFENIVFGLKRHPPEVIRQTCSDLLSRFDLRELAGRYPHQISGGQQQRVALARVLARRPRLLLLDEPLSALDSNLRDELRGQLRRLLTDFGIPVVLVTHDRTEAIALGDWIAVMEAGHIHQFGTVRDVFTHPAGLNVARIVGVETIVPGEIVKIENGLATVQVGDRMLVAVAPSQTQGESARHVHVCIKGEDVTLQRTRHSDSSVRNQLSGTVIRMSPEGALVRVHLDCGFELSAVITRPASEDLNLQLQDTVTASMKVSSIHLMERHDLA